MMFPEGADNFVGFLEDRNYSWLQVGWLLDATKNNYAVLALGSRRIAVRNLVWLLSEPLSSMLLSFPCKPQAGRMWIDYITQSLSCFHSFSAQLLLFVLRLNSSVIQQTALYVFAVCKHNRSVLTET